MATSLSSIFFVGLLEKCRYFFYEKAFRISSPFLEQGVLRTTVDNGKLTYAVADINIEVIEVELKFSGEKNKLRLAAEKLLL